MARFVVNDRRLYKITLFGLSLSERKDHGGIIPPVKQRQKETKVRTALLVFLCLLSCAISAQAQGDSSPKLSMVEIRPESAPGVYLEGAALSPDGEQVTAAFRRVGPGPINEIAISVRIWNVGTNEPIVSKELRTSLR